MKEFLTCLALAATLLLACKSGKYSPETYPKKQLVFGSGGGFTGAITAYHLLESGELYARHSLRDTGFVLVKKIPRKTVKTLWREQDSLALMNYDFDYPGNFYRFLEIHQDSLKHRILWEKESPKIRPEIVAYFERLLLLLETVE